MLTKKKKKKKNRTKNVAAKYRRSVDQSRFRYTTRLKRNIKPRLATKTIIEPLFKPRNELPVPNCGA